jgi:hypothetical protein
VSADNPADMRISLESPLEREALVESYTALQTAVDAS